MGADWLLPMVGSVGPYADAAGSWLLTYALHSSVLLLLAWLLVRVGGHRWSPAAQAAIWRVALVAGWVTASAQQASPWRSLGGALRLPERAQGAVAALQVREVREGGESLPAWRTAAIEPAEGTRHSALTIERTLVADGASQSALTRVVIVAVSFASIGVLLWAVVAAAGAAQLSWARRRLERALAGRHDAAESLAGHALRHLQRQGGVTRPVTLSLTDVLASPAALARDEIVLPLRAVHELTLAEQEAVLAHELAHVVRRDTAWLQLARWIERLAWFQPLNRLARRQMQLAAEFAADQWAARTTRQPLHLARALSHVASWRTTGGPPFSALAAGASGADGSPLLERVRRLTALPAERAPVGGRVAHGMMWLGAALALTLLPRVDVAARVAPAALRTAHVELRLTGDSLPPQRARLQWTTATGTAPRARRLPGGDAAMRALSLSANSRSRSPQQVPPRFIVIRRSAS